MTTKIARARSVAHESKSAMRKFKIENKALSKQRNELLDVMIGMANYIDKLGGDSTGFRAVIAAYKEKQKWLYNSI